MKKRFWALFLAVMMVVSVLPTSVFAEGESVDANLNPDPLYYSFEGKEVSAEDAKITLSKTAKYIGDGKYEITLTADAEQIVMPKATEVVFVLDASSSMNACTKTNCSHDKSTGTNCSTTNNTGYGMGSNNAVEAFKHPESRWVIATKAIADMKKALGDEGISYKYVAFGTNASVYTSYDDVDHGGINYTNLKKGVELGLKQFSNNDTNKVLIIVSDGESSDGYNPSGLNSFSGEVYAVGFTFSNEDFQNMADAGKYHTASDASELTFAMEKIAENIIGLITDPMGDSVDLLDTTVEVATDDKPDAVVTDSTINWTDSEGLVGEVKLTYEVEIKPTKKEKGPLEIPLNGTAKLNYSFNGEEKSIKFPVPKAVISAATLDVSYMLDEEEVDNDHEWINLTEGETFKTTVPEVGAEIKIKGKTYWVIAVKGEVPSKPGAEAYEVTVALSKNEPVTKHNIVYKIVGDYFANENYKTIESVSSGEALSLIADNMEMVGYTWSGWSGLPATMPNEDVTVTGSYQINQYAYTVNYYKDEIAAGNLLKTDTGNANFNAAIPYNNGGYLPDGYTAPGEVSGQPTVTAVAADNVLNIVYSKGTYQYAVKYYFDEVIDNTLTETSSAVYGSEISAYTDKNKLGYAFDYATAPITIGTGENVIKVYYATDEWKGGDGIPDKYQALVTYKVQGGTWDGTDKADKQEVFTLYTKNADGVWTAVNPAPVLGETIPTGMQPDAGYLSFGAWSASVPYKNTVAVNGDVFIYSFLAEQEITFHFDANGGKWDAAVTGYTMNEDLTIASVKIAQGSSVSEISPEPTAPECSVDGHEYVFAGWYAVADPDAEEYKQNPWNFSNEIYEDNYTIYAHWDLNELPVVPTFEATLIVNCQDENGASLKYEETELTDASWSYTPAETITIGEDKYIYEGITVYSPAQTLNGTAKNGEIVLLFLDYTLDNLNDKEDKPTGGDNIPDKYQALVTYKVVNGTWSDDTSADTIKVFTLKTLNAETGEWTDVEVSLGEMPAGMKPAAEYINKGEWDKTHAAADKPVHGEVYTYTFTTTKAPAVSITKTADKTAVKVGDKVTYTIVVENKGNVELTGVKVTDTFVAGGKGKLTVKSGELEIGTLAVGETATIVLEYVTVADDVKGLENSAVVKTNETEDAASTAKVTVTKKNEPVRPVGPSKPALNKADHYAYVVGYPDGLVHPEKNITRAEVSTIFFRMLLDESREDFWAQENWFSDVPADQWYNNAVSTLANAGLISGYPDGSFKPNANITRAEFATIAIRFFLEEDVEITENNLSDVKGHWAEANINLAYALNLINGYPDGTFRPDQKITRAEAMTIVNRVLERTPDKDHLLEDMIEWPDNMDKDMWYYADVQEATNSHEFYKTKDQDTEEVYEIWTELLPVRDWVALEQMWSQSNSSKNPGEVVDINITTP